MSEDRARLRFELRRWRQSGLRRLPAAAARVSPSPAAPARESAEPGARARPAAPPPAPPSRPAPEERPAPRADDPAETRPEPPAPRRAVAAPPADPAARQAELESLATEIRACTACKLCQKRTQAVPGEGRLDPPILFIGEGPGRDEDRSGRPFVGKAGQLLDKMIAAIGLDRSEVFIANIVKCRPPANRTPEPDEVKSCLPFLEQQIAALRPGLLCTLGLPSTRTLVPTVRSITAARGRQFVFRGIPLVPTFHPAYLLRNPSAKRQAWTDLKLVARLALDKEL